MHREDAAARSEWDISEAELPWGLPGCGWQRGKKRAMDGGRMRSSYG